MSDSQYSASELRQRYHRGGTIKDDELSSAQLRAKYAIPANRRDFSTVDGESSGGKSSAAMVGAALGVLILLAIAAYFFLSSK